ncbi:MAG: hypothetical protein PHH37_02010 [Paludibacter sp.]|nr:hypothetical protein [Paludibacter sp.]
MEKKYQIIYIWSFIIIGAIILILLYTPTGGNISKTNSINNSNIIINPTVDFESGIINSQNKRVIVKHQPLINNFYSSQNFSSNSNYSLVSENDKQQLPQSKSLLIVDSETNYRKSKNYKKNTDDTRYSSPVSFTSPFSSSSKVSSEPRNLTNITSIAEPFSETTSDNSVMQKGVESTSSLLDPGDDPVNPLPIGKGIIPFFIFAALYSIIIKFRK